MPFSLVGGTRAVLPAAWTRFQSVALLGGSRIDTGDAPGAAARLVAVSLFGGVRVTVAAGTRVEVRGFSLLGGRRLDISPAASGPMISVAAYTIFGGLNVSERSIAGSSR
jgi:hypothetical protein